MLGRQSDTADKSAAATGSEPLTSPVAVSVAELARLERRAQGLTLKPKQALARHVGGYLSPFKGRGMEYDESRLYQPGDDVRSLDWRVMARTGKAHTKLFREERERPVLLCVDLRQTMFFATRGVFKSVLAARLAALMGWVAHRHRDQVGGLVFSDRSHHELKPARGKVAVLHLLELLSRYCQWQRRPSVETASLSPVTVRLRRLARPGSLLVLISDFRGLDMGCGAHLAALAWHSEILLVSISDLLERRLPKAGQYHLSDGQHETTINTANRTFSQAYQQDYQQRQEALTDLGRRYGIALLNVDTADDPATVLNSGLSSR